MAKARIAKKSTNADASRGMKARLKNYRQAPRKVQLVASFVRGKRVERALTDLSHLNKRAAKSFKKLIESATANAKEVHGLNRGQLIIKEVRVDKGFIFTRFRPRSRGRATPIRKRTSHISVVLEEQSQTQEEKVEMQNNKIELKKRGIAKPTSSASAKL